LTFVPLDYEIALKSVELPGIIHQDPTDRIINATVWRVPVLPVTADAKIPALIMLERSTLPSPNDRRDVSIPPHQRDQAPLNPYPLGRENPALMPRIGGLQCYRISPAAETF
jgi:hypothetical protein